MTQYPTASGPYHDEFNDPPRTSAMAVVSLIFSLIGCCLPIGLLGTIFGIFSVIGISRSQGRVTGRGLAIAGIIIGVINTGIWIGAGTAIVGGVKVYLQMGDDLMTDLEAGDYQSLRTKADPSATFTDSQFDAFREAYHAEYGAYTGNAKGFGEMVSDFMDANVGPNMQNFQGQPGMIPFAMQFDQGRALVVYWFNPRNQGDPRFEDLMVVDRKGGEIRLSDFASAGGSPTPSGAAPDAEPDTQPGESPDEPDAGG